MEEILQTPGMVLKLFEYWDKLPTSTGARFLPSTVSSIICMLHTDNSEHISIMIHMVPCIMFDKKPSCALPGHASGLVAMAPVARIEGEASKVEWSKCWK